MNRPMKTLGQVYFLALIPCIGTAVAPWLFGPNVPVNLSLFVLWSFTILVVSSAAFWGYSVGLGKWVFLNGLCACLLVAFGFFAAVLALNAASQFAAISILAVLHWCAILWCNKSFRFGDDFLKQHHRFVWTLLATHMFVLFNVIYAMKA